MDTDNTESTVIDEALAAEAEETRERLIARERVPSALDASLARPNNRANVALPPTLFDSKAIHKPSLTMDPGNITSLPDFAELEGYGCKPAVEAMQALHTAVANVITAREAYATDATLTQAAAVLAIDLVHSQLIPVATRKMDAALKTLDSAITAAETNLHQAIKDTGTPLSQEVRAHVRSLKTAERMSVLTQAINSGDAVVVGALLGCTVPMLTGLDLNAEARAALVEQWNTKRAPDAAKKLALMKAARGKLLAAGTIAVNSTESMTGSKWTTVQRLRASKAKMQTVIGSIVPAA